MTVSKDYNKHVYEGNGLTRDWPYDFDLPITAAGAPDTSLIHVFRTNLRGEVTEVTAFSVDAETGTLTYPTSGSPLETGEKLTILRLLDVRQQFFDPSNQANLYPETLEDNTDRLVMMVQQLQEETVRAVKVSVSTDPDEEDTTAEGIFEARDIALSAATASEGWANTFPAIADELGVNLVTDEADLRAKLILIGASNATLVIAKPIPIAEDLAIPSNVALSFKKTGQLQPAASTTLTINGAIDAGLWQIFGGEGVTTGTPTLPFVLPEWFGAKGDGVTDDSTAYNNTLAFMSNGGKVVFTNGRIYRISSNTETPPTPSYLTIIAYGATIRSIDGVDTGRTIGLTGTAQTPCTYSQILGGTYDGNWRNGSDDDLAHLPGSNTCLSMSRANKCLLRDCFVVNAVNDGIAGSFSTDCRVESCSVDTTGEHNYYFSFSSHIKIINCQGKDPNQNQSLWSKAGVFVKFRESTHMLVDGFRGVINDTIRCHFAEGSGQYLTYRNISASGLAGGFYFTDVPSTLNNQNGPVYIENSRFVFSSAEVPDLFITISGDPGLEELSRYTNLYIEGAKTKLVGDTANDIHIKNNNGNLLLSVKYADGVRVENSSGYTYVNVNGAVIKNYTETGTIGTGAFRVYGENTTLDGLNLQPKGSMIACYSPGITVRNLRGSCSGGDVLLFSGVTASDVVMENVSIENCRYLIADSGTPLDAHVKNVHLNACNSLFRVSAASIIKYSGVSVESLSGPVTSNVSGGTATITKIDFV